MYTIDQVCAETGIHPHRVHNLVSSGVLPRPRGGRRYARYQDVHIRRIRELIRLRDERTTYADLAERWALEDDARTAGATAGAR